MELMWDILREIIGHLNVHPATKADLQARIPATPEADAQPDDANGPVN